MCKHKDVEYLGQWHHIFFSLKTHVFLCAAAGSLTPWKILEVKD